MANIKLRMTRTFPGMIDGVALPRQGETVSLTAERAAELIRLGVAEPVAEDAKAPAEVRETRVQGVSEKRSPGRPRKN